jgi:hypothetical protein
VLVNLNESNELLDEGVIAVTYKIDWTRLPGAPPPPTPADKVGGGKWVLAAPTPQLVGEQYLQTIGAGTRIRAQRLRAALPLREGHGRRRPWPRSA